MKTEMRTLLFILVCLCGCLGLEANAEENFLTSLLWKCTKTEDVEGCLKSNALTVLDDMIRMKEPLRITEYLSLARDPKAPESDLQDLGVEEGRNEDWDRIVWNKLTALFKTRTPQLNIPPDMFEGRGKEGKILKKGHGVFLMAAMMGGMMMKMALGKIALIAGKALIIGKIALILSLVIALKKISGQGGGGGGHSEVVYTSSEHGSGRKLVEDPPGGADGAELAYNAHR